MAQSAWSRGHVALLLGLADMLPKLEIVVICWFGGSNVCLDQIKIQFMFIVN